MVLPIMWQCHHAAMTSTITQISWLGFLWSRTILILGSKDLEISPNDARLVVSACTSPGPDHISPRINFPPKLFNVSRNQERCPIWIRFSSNINHNKRHDSGSSDSATEDRNHVNSKLCVWRNIEDWWIYSTDDFLQMSMMANGKTEKRSYGLQCLQG